MRFHLYSFILLHLTSQISSQQSNEQHVHIDLPKNGGNTTFTYKLNLTHGDIIVDVASETEDRFFVIQAHSFQSNISLSKTDSLVLGSYVIGANIGLVETPLKAGTVYRYYVKPISSHNFQVLISVISYAIEDPIPGGCNMVYNTKLAPYQILSFDDHMVQVDAAPALDFSCDVSYPRLDMYQVYLDEGSSDIDAYFLGIEKLMTVDGIKRYAKKVSDSVHHKPLRRYYSAYPGTGTIYAIIATSGNASSAYVPIATYACDVFNWDETCVGPVSVIWKVLCALILFMGVFMCFLGNRFFMTSMFIFGFVCGSFISYISFPFVGTSSAGYGLGVAIGFGVCYGISWCYYWWRYGIPILSVIIPVFFTGYVIACISFHAGLADLDVFESDLSYWSTFFGIIIPIMLILLLVTLFGNIVSCSMIGASAIVITIDHYIGSTVHYIIINNVRRAIVKGFNQAILNPPYQYKDVILTVTWIALLMLGVAAQFKQQQGRPPFPPRRNGNRGTVFSVSETTPLLY